MKTLRAYRKSRGLTQEALAAELELNIVTYRKYERGESLPRKNIGFEIIRKLDGAVDYNGLALVPGDLLRDGA
tara:strand:- start:1097 stop:1315 length:219 start_codon:yes stop_codon:yes gene_type:complete